MEYVTLNNAVRMPVLGYGVYQVDPRECERCVSNAIDVGYRSIDTAQAYHNEGGVGEAISKCGVPREELFLTTKVWISNAGYEKAKASIEQSLRKLKTDYIDLMLIHQPFNDYYGTYRAMEEAYRAGKLRSIRWRPIRLCNSPMPMRSWRNMGCSMNPGVPLQKAKRECLQTQSSKELRTNTEKPSHRSFFAF